MSRGDQTPTSLLQSTSLHASLPYIFTCPLHTSLLQRSDRRNDAHNLLHCFTFYYAPPQTNLFEAGLQRREVSSCSRIWLMTKGSVLPLFWSWSMTLCHINWFFCSFGVGPCVYWNKLKPRSEISLELHLGLMRGQFPPSFSCSCRDLQKWAFVIYPLLIDGSLMSPAPPPPSPSLDNANGQGARTPAAQLSLSKEFTHVPIAIDMDMGFSNWLRVWCKPGWPKNSLTA